MQYMSMFAMFAMFATLMTGFSMFAMFMIGFASFVKFSGNLVALAKKHTKVKLPVWETASQWFAVGKGRTSA